MIRDQSERNFALIGEFFVGRVLPVDEDAAKDEK
jgi:hypothetical protein